MTPSRTTKSGRRSKTRRTAEPLSNAWIDDVCGRISASKSLRRTLPEGGRIHIDRPLPFLCVYRQPPGDDGGASRLITSEAAYLSSTWSPEHARSLHNLVREVVATLAPQFGAFLVLEMWIGDPIEPATATNDPPAFVVTAPRDPRLNRLVARLDEELARIQIARKPAAVTIRRTARNSPPGRAPVLTHETCAKHNAVVIGLEVRPIFMDGSTGESYPRILKALERKLTRALRKAFYEFTCTLTTQCPAHYHVLGRRAVVKAVWDVDEKLSAVADSYDLLLQVTPTNAAAAWNRFKSSGYDRAPRFEYRPLAVDTHILKRELHAAPLERIEDPALDKILHQKADELDREITLLSDRETHRFLHGSIQLFGEISPSLATTAKGLLSKLPPADESRQRRVKAEGVRKAAAEEFDRYRAQWKDMKTAIEIRDDTVGLMVSKGTLLIGADISIPKARVPALLAHEIGTHALTHSNGASQPLRLLRSGLAGYEALQEGLAVFAEFLAGGLTVSRIRLLAARVVAAQMVVDGADFITIHRNLVRDHGFARRTAFTLTTRIVRGGGFTKDAVYLKGLIQVLDYLKNGGELDPLFVGKIAVNHIPIVRELLWRRVLLKPRLQPNFLTAPGAPARLERARGGMTVLDLVQ